jgi:hypothetical protein
LLCVFAPACSLLVPTSDLAESRPPRTPSPDGGSVSSGTGPSTPPDAGADIDAGSPISDPSLVGAWSFDETSGNTSVDVSGHGHTANLIGPSFAPGGVRGGCVNLAGDSSFVAVEDFSGAGFPRTGTFSIWFRWASMNVGDQNSVLDTWDGTYDHVFLRHANGDTVGTFQIALQTLKPAGYVFESDFPIAQDHWSHVVFSWDETNRQAVSYVDGKEVLRGQYTMPFSPTGEHFHLGQYLTGAIDEVRLYNRALDGAEATALP